MILFWTLPILKESGPQEVLLTHMAKKSRSAQAVSIFYDSSWVLPRVCPCHSHLKTPYRVTMRHSYLLGIWQNVKQALTLSHCFNVSIYYIAYRESFGDIVKMLQSEAEAYSILDEIAFLFSCYLYKLVDGN